MKRREHETLEVPIATLIDVVFLLIIFFVVTATLQRDKIDEKVRLAQAPHIEPAQDETLRLTINIRRDDEGAMRYSINGSEMNLVGVNQRLREAARNRTEGMRIVLRADTNLQYREVDKVGRLAAAVGLPHVYHAGDPSKQ